METKDAAYDFLAPPGTIARGNVTEQVTGALRRAIVSLRLKPGEAIDKTAVCAALGVSRFPVSEAMGRLRAEGLVDILPQRGSRVSLIRVADVAEFMLIRKAIEAEAVRELVEADIPDIAEKLAASLAEQRRAASADDREAFHQADCAFHEILFTAMQFSRVKTIIDNVRANVDRARRLITAPRRLAPTISEHEAIHKGIVVKDADRAANAMRDHIDAVMQEVLAFAVREPRHFADGADYAGRKTPGA